MKSRLLLTLPACALLAGCAFGARSPDMYRDDTQALLATKSDDIRACYDGVLKTTPGASGTVAITFDVETKGGRLANLAVDRSKTTAPQPVVACVTQGLEGLALAPPDVRTGKASWTYHFTPPPPPAASTNPTAPQG